ncbi:MAG: hypothetical protein CMJ86_08270 [Planctomycetes bacterium]|jgi:hypothetical protein|nr:hypothetical protein [Planctomycetota bacterium]
MNPDLLIGRLAVFAPCLRQLLEELDPQDARWRPPDGGWSMLEIVCHLADEEREDFRGRLEFVLGGRQGELAPIDPLGWIESRGYNELDFSRSLERFCLERRRTVGWLRSLKRPDWKATIEHPKLGPISAGDLLASLAAHDALHMRQISSRFHALALRDAPGFSVAYAGAW